MRKQTVKEGTSVPSNLVIYWSPDWRINSDELQWIVQKRGVVEKTGREYWTPKAYCQNLCRAIDVIVHREIRALSVSIPADPGCELILNLENRLDEWFERLLVTVRSGGGGGLAVSDIKGLPKVYATACDGRRSGKNLQQKVAE